LCVLCVLVVPPPAAAKQVCVDTRDSPKDAVEQGARVLALCMLVRGEGPREGGHCVGAVKRFVSSSVLCLPL
jgi:hypothetical protein